VAGRAKADLCGGKEGRLTEMTTEQEKTSGTLYVVATPIGNLEDITYRAVRVLAEVDLVAAEDTRHSRKLFDRFGIKKPLVSYHDHNERQRQEALLEQLQEGKDIALISDAGTPCIADPGYRLIGSCQASGIRVVPVPGASALITALSAAGVATDRFAFEGYLPQKRKARTDLLKKLAGEQRTLVFYEAPHRLQDSLVDFHAIIGGERQIVVARELTKLHEEFYCNSIEEAVGHYAGKAIKGEIVLILPPGDDTPKVEMKVALKTLLSEGELSRREAVKIIAREYNLPSSDVYRESLRLTELEAEE
jgi:16S rRNA (cytidine1402-2'-O)-methyltransferase